MTTPTETSNEEIQPKPLTENDTIKALKLMLNEDRDERAKETAQVLSEIRRTNERIDSLQDMVDAVADKGRLNEFEKKQAGGAGTKKKIVRLQMVDGKVVVGWTQMKTNKVYKESRKGSIVEDQTTTLKFADGTTKEVEYRIWQAERRPVEMELQGIDQDLENDTSIYKLKDSEGNYYEVDHKFVN